MGMAHTFLFDRRARHTVAAAVALFLVAAAAVAPVPADTLSPSSARELFEWGEYGKLITLLEPYLSTPGLQLDSSTQARLHCYLGVARFASGRIGDARAAFLAALRLDNLVEPDSAYITDEIADLFRATRLEFRRDELFTVRQDSILNQQKLLTEESIRRIRHTELRQQKRSSTAFAASFYAVGGILGAIAAYEYLSTREFYDLFREAADSGDKAGYERYRGILQNANAVILSCGIASGASFSSGLIFTFRALTLHATGTR